MKIPVVIHETTGLDRKQDLINGGIPVAQGAAAKAGWFTLTGADGKKHSVYGSPNAFWPDKSVKWLHLCGLVDLEGGKANNMALEPSASRKHGLRVEPDGRFLRIRGGVLDVEVRTDVLDFLTASFAKDGTPLLRSPGISTGLTLVGPDKANRRACSFELDFLKTPEAVVDTPGRVVVRLSGKYFIDGGREVALLRLFIEVLRDAPEIRLQPVLIYTGIPNEDLIESFTLTAHTAVAAQETTRYTFGNEQGSGYEDVLQRYPNGPRWPLARQVQLGSSFYRTEKATCREASWLKALEGQRAQGWCDLTDDRFGVTAAMRYFWEEYPRALEIDAYAGTITFGLCPDAAEPLDLRRYSPTVYGGGPPEVTMYETGSGAFRHRSHGATGTAKAHELAIRFHPAKAKDAGQRGLFFTKPCRPMTPARHFCASKVVGAVAPAHPAAHAKGEAKMAKIMEFLVHEREVRGWYGLMNFGDVQMSYYYDLDRWAYDDGGHAWINTEAAPDYCFWLMAWRSHRPDWFEAAIAMTRHNRDVDIYHTGELKGCGTRHNVNHWGCPDKEWRVGQPLVKRLHYYTTGDPWSAEVIRETVERYQSMVRTVKFAPSALACMIGVYTRWEMTADPKYREAAVNLGRLYAKTVRDDGQFGQWIVNVDLSTGIGETTPGNEATPGQFFLDVFGGRYALSEMAEALDDEALTAALLRQADFYYDLEEKSERGHVYTYCPFYALAYRRTGDKRYLRAIKEAVDNVDYFQTEDAGGDDIADEPPHQKLVGVNRRNKFNCSLATWVCSLSYGLAELESKHK